VDNGCREQTKISTQSRRERGEIMKKKRVKDALGRRVNFFSAISASLREAFWFSFFLLTLKGLLFFAMERVPHD
jgi:hypothetical protein